METRRLGRLGHRSSVLIYGAGALSDVTQDVADRSIQEALDGGINHLDVAASTGTRSAARSLDVTDPGPDLPGHKTGERHRESAWREINASLERLQTDRVDLIQLHSVGDLTERTWPPALTAHWRRRPGRSTKASSAPSASPVTAGSARHASRGAAPLPVRYGADALNPVLWRHDAYRSDYLALVEEVRRQDAGLMTIKTGSRRNWPEGAEHTHTTWYEPFDEQERITAAVSWVLSHDEVTGIPTAGDVRLLRLFLEAERNRVSPPMARPRCRRTSSMHRLSSRCRSRPGGPAPGAEVPAGGRQHRGDEEGEEQAARDGEEPARCALRPDGGGLDHERAHDGAAEHAVDDGPRPHGLTTLQRAALETEAHRQPYDEHREDDGRPRRRCGGPCRPRTAPDGSRP